MCTRKSVSLMDPRYKALQIHCPCEDSGRTLGRQERQINQQQNNPLCWARHREQLFQPPPHWTHFPAVVREAVPWVKISYASAAEEIRLFLFQQQNKQKEKGTQLCYWNKAFEDLDTRVSFANLEQTTSPARMWAHIPKDLVQWEMLSSQKTRLWSLTKTFW